MIPETKASDRLAEAIHEALYPRVLTLDYCRVIASKLTARREFVQAVLAELAADPERVADRDVVLRRDATARFDDDVWWLEEQAYHENAARECAAQVARIKAGTLGQLVDRDDRAAQEDTDRLNAERAADKAAASAPKVAS